MKSFGIKLENFEVTKNKKKIKRNKTNYNFEEKNNKKLDRKKIK